MAGVQAAGAGQNLPESRARWRENPFFSAEEIHSLEFTLLCSTVQPPPELRIELFLPNGDLYETLEAKKVVEEAGRNRRDSRSRAVARLPVAGTLIVQYQLFGRWSARPCWTEGITETCSRETAFTLDR